MGMVVITAAAAAFFCIGFGLGRDRADEQLKGGQNTKQ